MFAEGFPSISFISVLLRFLSIFLVFHHQEPGHSCPVAREKSLLQNWRPYQVDPTGSLGLFFKVSIFSYVLFPTLIFCYNLAQIHVYLHFQLLSSLLKANPSPFGHSTGYCRSDLTQGQKKFNFWTRLPFCPRKVRLPSERQIAYVCRI